MVCHEDHSDKRWTVDELKDFNVIKNSKAFKARVSKQMKGSGGEINDQEDIDYILNKTNSTVSSS